MDDAVFLGRSDELARFNALLGVLPLSGRSRTFERSRNLRSRAEQAEADRSRVVLVHGLGGIGKSRLLRQFRLMADGRLPGSPVSRGQVRTVWLDWEDEQRDRRASYGQNGPDLVTVLDAVQGAVIEAFGADANASEHVRRAFNLYRQGVIRMPTYTARFADVIAQSKQAGSPFTGGDAAALLKSLASVGLLGSGHPLGILGLTPDQLVASAQAAGHLTEAATRAVTGKKAGEISPEEYDLVTDPSRELTRRVAVGLRATSEMMPLVFFIDTGEVIGEVAWRWLRRVMTLTGRRCMWVVGGRFETDAEAGVDNPVAQFAREVGDADLLVMSPARFDGQMITDYLTSRSSGRNYDSGQIDLIARFTRGVPLAVSLTVELLERGESVESVCAEVDDGLPTSVVSRLARRYLIHAEQATTADDPRHGDVAKIIGLALAFGDLRTDPELLAVLWAVPDPLGEYQDLARRHDFVLPTSRRLHDDVRDILRADLLDPWRRARVREISQRALGLYGTRLAYVRSRWPTLDQQLEHRGFITALLALLWHTFWLDNQVGLDLFNEILPVLAIADSAIADAAAVIVKQFAGTFDQDQRRDLDMLTNLQIGFLRGWSPDHRKVPVMDEKHRMGIFPANLPMRPTDPNQCDWLIGEPGDREVAIMILHACLQAADYEDRAAIATLRTAAAQTASTRLRYAIGSQAHNIANRLIWAGPNGTAVPTPTGLAAAEIATELLPASASAWFSYAAALDDLGNSKEALVAWGQALEIDSSAARTNAFKTH